MQHQLQCAIRILNSKRKVESYDWSSLNYSDLIRVRSALLEQGKSGRTVNLCISALNGVAQCAFHLKILKAEQLMHIKSVKRISVRKKPSGRSLNPKEIRSLLKCCKADRSNIGIRDLALLVLMITTGLRRAEVASLNIENYEKLTGKLNIFHTKGNKDRVCYLPEIAIKHIKKWLIKHGRDTGPIFVRIRKKGIVAGRLSTQSIYNIVRNRAHEAGVGKLTPHDLRRTGLPRVSRTN